MRNTPRRPKRLSAPVQRALEDVAKAYGVSTDDVLRVIDEAAAAAAAAVLRRHETLH
jgi:hypothetical protein